MATTSIATSRDARKCDFSQHAWHLRKYIFSTFQSSDISLDLAKLDPAPGRAVHWGGEQTSSIAGWARTELGESLRVQPVRWSHLPHVAQPIRDEVSAWCHEAGESKCVCALGTCYQSSIFFYLSKQNTLVC